MYFLIKFLDDASFSYAYCFGQQIHFLTLTPTVTYIMQGTYACSDNNLSMSSNGLIDLSAISLPGNYTITHTSSDCPNLPYQRCFDNHYLMNVCHQRLHL